MTNYKEILRLQSLGINNTRIAEACGCARSTVISTLQYATAKGLKWDSVRDWTEKEVAEKLLPSVAARQTYKMPDYGYVHREMQKSGVRLNLLWLEYCEQCRSVGELPYKSTQFNKYYADYVHKTKATMHLEHKPGDVIQVDWAGPPILSIRIPVNSSKNTCSLPFCHTADIPMWKHSRTWDRKTGSEPM